MVSLALFYAVARLYLQVLYDWDRGAPIGLPFFLVNAAALGGITTYLVRRRRSGQIAVTSGMIAGGAYMLVFLIVGHYEEDAQIGHALEPLLGIPLLGLLPSTAFLIVIILSAIWVNARRLFPGAKDKSPLE